MAIVDPRDVADERFPNPRKALLRPLLRQQDPTPLLEHLRERPESLKDYLLCVTPGEDPGKEFRLRLEGVGERLSLWGWRNDLHDLKDDDLAALFFALEDLVEGFLGGLHQSNGDDSFLGTPMGASFLSLLRWRVGFTVNPLEDIPQHWLSLGFQPVPRAMVAALSDELLRDGESLISPALWEGLLVKLKRPPLFSAHERAAFSENLKPLAQGLRELEAEGVSELPPGLVESFVGSLLQRRMRELQQAAQAAR